MRPFILVVSAIVAVCCLMASVTCERDKILFCGACIALIDELNWLTETISPKRKMQVGSFQLDAKGNMNVKEVPLAQSEVHLTEVMEYVCRYMYTYVGFMDQKGNTNYIRTASRDGHKISKRHTVDLKEKKGTLEFACDTILEAHDDELMSLYQAKDKDIAQKLCVDMTGLCTAENVSDHLWAYANAVMMGMTEKAAADGDPMAMEKLAKMEAAEAGEDADDQDDDDEEDVFEEDSFTEEIIDADDDDQTTVRSDL